VAKGKQLSNFFIFIGEVLYNSFNKCQEKCGALEKKDGICQDFGNFALSHN
jgi:hypothetical protein